MTKIEFEKKIIKLINKYFEMKCSKNLSFLELTLSFDKLPQLKIETWGEHEDKN